MLSGRRFEETSENAHWRKIKNATSVTMQPLGKQVYYTFENVMECTYYDNTHCKLAILSRRQKPMLPGGRYRSMSPAGRQMNIFGPLAIFLRITISSWIGGYNTDPCYAMHVEPTFWMLNF